MDQTPKGPKRPPRWQIAFALISFALCIAFAAIGMNFEYIAGIYVKGPAVFACVFFFMATMYYPFKSMDDHRDNNPDDPDSAVK